jgi:hypothetical protein
LFFGRCTAAAAAATTTTVHGQYIRGIEGQLIDDEDTSRRDLKAQTVNEIVAPEDQALKTKYHTTETDSKCRLTTV